METLYIWLLIFAGTMIGLLGTLLFASERELGSKREECDILRRNRTEAALGRVTAPQESQTHPSAELMMRNSDLAEKISSLSSRLEESQRTVDRLQTEQQALSDTQAANQKLGAENHHLQQEVANLRERLHTNGRLLDTTAGQHQEVADRHSLLQSELTELRQQMNEVLTKNQELLENNDLLSNELAANQRTTEDLQATRDRLSGIKSENQQLHAANQELGQELANMQRQMQTSQAQLNHATSQNQELAERQAKLQSEIVEFKQQLQARQKTIEELEADQGRLDQVKFETRGLRQEIADLRNQLQWSENRLSESARQNQEATDRCARLQTELVDLKEQLEECQSTARQWESAQHQLANVAAREMIFGEQQRELERQINELERALSDKNDRQELDRAHRRLAEADDLCQELREHNRRLNDEIAQLQEHLDTSGENERQITILRHQLSAWQEQNQQLQEDLAAERKLTDRSSPTPPDANLSYPLEHTTHGGESTPPALQSTFGQEAAESEANSPLHDSADDGYCTPPGREDSKIHVANEGENKLASPTWARRKRRFGMIPAIVVLAIGTAATIGIVATRSNDLSDPKEPAVAPETVSRERSESGAKTPQELSKPAQRAKQPRLRGTFEITRPTQIYSGPSENSGLIASIDKGMKINVVDSRGGWLEIRSKHGRPPGFVRQEAAVKVGQN
jgi:DNA repair ATPase RecN